MLDSRYCFSYSTILLLPFNAILQKIVMLHIFSILICGSSFFVVFFKGIFLGNRKKYSKWKIFSISYFHFPVVYMRLTSFIATFFFLRDCSL